jgi:hypothetical protein
VAGQALTTLVNVSIFLAYGTTAAVARQLGAGHRQAAIRQGIDGLWLAGLIGWWCSRWAGHRRHPALMPGPWQTSERLAVDAQNSSCVEFNKR